MNNRENWNSKSQDHECFISDTIDEQIESLSSAKIPEQQHHADARVIRDLTAIYQEDATSLNRIWQRLSAHKTFDTANQRVEEAPQLREEHTIGDTLPIATQRKRPLQQSLGMIAAVACMILLVGSLAIVLNMARNIGTGRTSNALCTPSGKNTAAPATVVYAEKPGQSGLYVVGDQGIYRFDVQDGQPQPLWLFKMNACTAITPTIYPHLKSVGITPLPSIYTGAAIANNMVYFGVNQDTGGYLYALHASNGSLAWKVKAGPIGTPLVLNGLVFIETEDDAGDLMIMAFDARDGSVRWSYRYPSSITNQSEGLGAVGAGRVYVSTSNTIFTLDAATGKQVWSTNIEIGQIVIATRFFDGMLYATASSTCFNCEVQPGTSAVYALSPATGKKVWESQKVAGYLSPPTETRGMVYFGSIDGYVHAVHANDGKQIWQSYVYGEVRAAPLVVDGIVYVSSGRFLDPTKQSTANGQIYVLDTAGETKGSMGFRGVIDDTKPMVAGHGVVYISTWPNFLNLVRAGGLVFIAQLPIPNISSNDPAAISPILTLVP